MKIEISKKFSLSTHDVVVMSSAYEAYKFDLEFPDLKDDPGWRTLDWHTFYDQRYSPKHLLDVGVFEWQYAVGHGFYRISKIGIQILEDLKKEGFK